MELKDVMLGFLEWRRLTGYELKGLFVDLDFLPWSGNNNQIYKVLVEMEKEGLVEKELIPGEKYPTQKRYSITWEGQKFLRGAVLSAAELPHDKHDFLLHLAWSQCLTNKELISLVEAYWHDVEMEMVICQEKWKRRDKTMDRSERERYVWEMIGQNRITALQQELDWLYELREGLQRRSYMTGE